MKEPIEIFKNAVDNLWVWDDNWSDEEADLYARTDFGYVTTRSGIWHLADGRNYRVTFEEVTLSNI